MKTDNELIAEFMGEKIFNYGADPVYIEGPSFPSEPPYEAEYQTSWDWLMPVVDKIDNSGFRVWLGKTNCSVYQINVPGYPDGKPIVFDVARDRISAAYKTVVRFIKWYNDQKK